MRVWRLATVGDARELTLTREDGAEIDCGRVPQDHSDLDVLRWLARNNHLQHGDAFVQENRFVSFVSVHDWGTT